MRFKAREFLVVEKRCFRVLPCYADYTMLKAIDFGLYMYIDEGIITEALNFQFILIEAL